MFKVKAQTLEDFIMSSEDGEMFKLVKVMSYDGDLSALQRVSDKAVYLLPRCVREEIINEIEEES